jgi:hypothetical protein
MGNKRFLRASVRSTSHSRLIETADTAVFVISADSCFCPSVARAEFPNPRRQQCRVCRDTLRNQPPLSPRRVLLRRADNSPGNQAKSHMGERVFARVVKSGLMTAGDPLMSRNRRQSTWSIKRLHNSCFTASLTDSSWRRRWRLSTCPLNGRAGRKLCAAGSGAVSRSAAIWSICSVLADQG